MGPKRKPTRAKDAEKYAGHAAKLPESDLPTYGDIARYFYLVQETERDFATQVNIVKEGLEVLWQKCNPALPVLDKLTIRRKLVMFLERVKSDHRKSLKVHHKETILAQENKLFDIAACTCDLRELPCTSKFVNCNAENCTNIHLACDCGPGKRVPIEEREYLKEQRAKRGTISRFQLGGIDRGAAKREARREDREASHSRMLQKEACRLQENVQLEMSFGSEVS